MHVFEIQRNVSVLTLKVNPDTSTGNHVVSIKEQFLAWWKYYQQDSNDRHDTEWGGRSIFLDL